MTPLELKQPLVFEPIFKERLWGGRRLETLYRKQLPAGQRIGESWEIVDRQEAQSIVASGPLRGWNLHDLWKQFREAIFGPLPESERFPLLIKLLDADQKLSLQVHPPPRVAAELNGEPKTEFWYITAATSKAELYVGLKKHSSRLLFEQAIKSGTVEAHVHRVAVRTGDAMFLPSGRMHAIGAGSVIVEIQENSDTTYRVFDWNRLDEHGSPRQLHVGNSLRSIDFEDFEPALLAPEGEKLVAHDLFHVDKWTINRPRAASPPGKFAIVVCLSGEVACAGRVLTPGNFFLVPACLAERNLEPRAENSSLLRVTIGGD